MKRTRADDDYWEDDRVFYGFGSVHKFRVRTPWSAKTYEEQAQQKFAALLARASATAH